MTPQQEKKLDDLNAICLTMNGKFDVQDEKFRQHFQAIIDTRLDIKKQSDRVDSLETDRDKAKGALGILTFIGLGSLATAIGALFKH